MFGCEKSKTPASDEKEIINTDDYLYGEVIHKVAPNMLVLDLGTSSFSKKWGKTVYVITDDFDSWCIEDDVSVDFSVAEVPEDKSQCVKIIADRVYARSNGAMDKPIIYFYPETPTVCSAKVTLNGELTCTYPEHGDEGWKDFTAYPDGTLIFPDGKEYYALYWEGRQSADWDFSTGFCVRGEDTAEFLEWALEKQGLNRREANEFIVYWLPLMQDNPYNVISFQTTAYTDVASLDITPAPDSLLRVFMAYYPVDSEVEIEPQTFAGFTREGFTVVEWGGSKVAKP